MINFSIKELNAFAVIGQEVELTNYQKKNILVLCQDLVQVKMRFSSS